MPTLDWLNRADAFRTAARVPYRRLEAVSSYVDGDTRNLLIQGDNLEALKAREKRRIGESWATRTGQCFGVIEKELNGEGMAAQIRLATEA